MKLDRIEVSAYRIPTDRPEADGTLAWDSTTLVLVEVFDPSGEHGQGYTYASASAGQIIRNLLAPVVLGIPDVDVGAAWEAMVNRTRNIGREGVAATAISALDMALWDLKAHLAGMPLYVLLGAHRSEVPVYGSGGFTTYSDQELADQLQGWTGQGITRVKIKIGKDWGTRPEQDIAWARAAREAIGPQVELFVDANGAYTAKQAIRQAVKFEDYGVSYFEEPVSSDHLADMRFVREHIPMDVAAGEYGYDPWYFKSMLASQAVDILQADATRCLGVSGWMQAAALAYGFNVPFSAHTAPAIHAQLACAAPQISHIEYFHDHVRIERLLFDGFPALSGGCLKPDPSRPGHGLVFKRQEAERWRIPL